MENNCQLFLTFTPPNEATKRQRQRWLQKKDKGTTTTRTTERFTTNEHKFPRQANVTNWGWKWRKSISFRQFPGTERFQYFSREITSDNGTKHLRSYNKKSVSSASPPTWVSGISRIRILCGANVLRKWNQFLLITWLDRKWELSGNGKPKRSGN